MPVCPVSRTRVVWRVQGHRYQSNAGRPAARVLAVVKAIGSG